MSQSLKRPHNAAFPSLTPYGTPLPDPTEDGDSGAFLPVWKQDAVDERGRKRFHGAFTGGWSAGYFNSVGSKDGFVPKTFVSSRGARAGAKDGSGQKVEDFMDDEDMQEKEEGERVAVAKGFGGLGKDGEDTHGNGLLDLVGFGRKESIGSKLLGKMGWREGQGIGARVKRLAKGEEGGEEHWFAPTDTKILSLEKNLNNNGFGYASDSNGNNAGTMVDDDEDDDAMVARSRLKHLQPTAKVKKASFGVGVLNDTGSDDEDPYEVGPKISYSTAIGVKRSKKLAKTVNTASNNLITTKPVFVSRKKITHATRKCHDGKLPLDGFILATILEIYNTTKHPPPSVPADWKSSKVPNSAKALETSFSTAEAARQSSLDPRSRGAILGETPLPGKSVFSYLTPQARERLVKITGNQNLPQALSECHPESQTTQEERQRSLWDLVPQLDNNLARSALSRGTSLLPYADDLTKRARYIAFLEISAGLRTGGLPERGPRHTLDEWSAEMREFAQAAHVFRPMNALMASRFTTSSGTIGARNDKDLDGLLRSGKRADEPKDAAEEAAKLGMFGPLTRSVQKFQPTRLVCKRLGIPVPEGDIATDDTGEQAVSMPVSKYDMDKMMQESLSRMGPSSGSELVLANYSSTPAMAAETAYGGSVDVETNDALESERPGDAVFRAIFGEDDE